MALGMVDSELRISRWISSGCEMESPRPVTYPVMENRIETGHCNP